MFTAGEGSTRITVRSVWFLLLYASDFLDRITADERERLLCGEHDNDLLDALAAVLATRVEKRMRMSVAAGERTRTTPLRRVRGRIDHLGTARGRMMESGRILCTYGERTVDIPRYRWMLVTLRWAARRASSATVQRKCVTTAQVLERMGVTRKDPTAVELSTEQFGHSDSEDRTLLSLSRLVRDMCAPEHTPGANELPAIRRDERALRRLFEKAVVGFYRHHLEPQGFSVRSMSTQWPAEGDPADLAFVPRLNADVVIRGRGQQTVIECKFAPIFTSYQGKPMLKPDFLRQLHSYSTVFRSEFVGTTRAVLLGALVEGSPGRDLDMTISGIPIAVRQIDLAEGPGRIREALLSAFC